MKSINVCSCVIIIGSEILLAQFRQTCGHLFVCPLNLRFHFTIANKIYPVNDGRWTQIEFMLKLLTFSASLERVNSEILDIFKR